MSDPMAPIPPHVPAQPEPKSPVRKTTPIVVALVIIMALIGIANLSSLLRGNKKSSAAGSLPMTRPMAPDAQQVTGFERQQKLEAERDAEEQRRQKEAAAALEALETGEGGEPGPEAAKAPPMTAAQRATIYGESPNAPTITSEVSQARAEAKQKELARAKAHEDALASPTLAIDFSQPRTSWIEPASISPPASLPPGPDASPLTVGSTKLTAGGDSDPSRPNGLDEYRGRLYRIFEGSVLEGVVTNHVDGGFSGPILVMLTADYYSHDHQQLLIPQGTRLIGSVAGVGSAQQRKMFVTFHRAICPDGFSLDFDKYLGLDPIGTTGLATNVSHGYLQAFAAAAAIGGLGGLTQIGNNASVLNPSAQLRNGVSAQSAEEAEQVLNHFLGRLPVITLKEGSRARVYIGRDILVPAYSEHHVDPTL